MPRIPSRPSGLAARPAERPGRGPARPTAAAAAGPLPAWPAPRAPRPQLAPHAGPTGSQTALLLLELPGPSCLITSFLRCPPGPAQPPPGRLAAPHPNPDRAPPPTPNSTPETLRRPLENVSSASLPQTFLLRVSLPPRSLLMNLPSPSRGKISSESLPPTPQTCAGSRPKRSPPEPFLQNPLQLSSNSTPPSLPGCARGFFCPVAADAPTSPGTCPPPPPPSAPRARPGPPRRAPAAASRTLTSAAPDSDTARGGLRRSAPSHRRRLWLRGTDNDGRGQVVTSAVWKAGSL